MSVFVVGPLKDENLRAKLRRTLAPRLHPFAFGKRTAQNACLI